MTRTLAPLALGLAVFAESDLLAQNKVVAEIPITVEHNKTIVRVAAGGSSLRLILDSGMASDGILIFDKDKIDTTAFGPLRGAAVGGAGSGPGSTVLVGDAARFIVGRLVFEHQRVMILSGHDFKGFPTDGVIGYSLLGHFAVEIDYDTRVMTLYENASFTPEPGWESLKIYFKGNRIPWADILIGTDHEPLVRIAAYIDFASSEALELLCREANRFRLPAKTTGKYLGRGLSGDIHGQEGTISRMRIGPYLLTDVVVAIAPASVRSRQKDADGIVGNNALRRFNVIFDYAHNRIHLRPNSHFSEPFGGSRPAVVPQGQRH